jgi:hypothetical protein
MAFKQRVETILKRFDVYGYRECPKGATVKTGIPDDLPWVEMNIRPLKKRHDRESCFITSKELAQLAKLFGTEARYTSYDMSLDDDGTDYVGYVVAFGVKF